MELLENKNIQYTRYADDLLFSSDDDNLKWLGGEIEKLLPEWGFSINCGKTKLFGTDAQKLVMGLNLTKGIKIQNIYKRKLRQEIYYCKKYGIENHLQQTGADDRSNFAAYIYGKAYFVKMVEPELGKDMLRELDDLFKEAPYF